MSFFLLIETIVPEFFFDSNKFNSIQVTEIENKKIKVNSKERREERERTRKE